MSAAEDRARVSEVERELVAAHDDLERLTEERDRLVAECRAFNDQLTGENTALRDEVGLLRGRLTERNAVLDKVIAAAAGFTLDDEPQRMGYYNGSLARSYSDDLPPWRLTADERAVRELVELRAHANELEARLSAVVAVCQFAKGTPV